MGHFFVFFFICSRRQELRSHFISPQFRYMFWANPPPPPAAGYTLTSTRPSPKRALGTPGVPNRAKVEPRGHVRPCEAVPCRPHIGALPAHALLSVGGVHGCIRVSCPAKPKQSPSKCSRFSSPHSRPRHFPLPPLACPLCPRPRPLTQCPVSSRPKHALHTPRSSTPHGPSMRSRAVIRGCPCHALLSSVPLPLGPR